MFAKCALRMSHSKHLQRFVYISHSQYRICYSLMYRLNWGKSISVYGLIVAYIMRF